MFLIYLEIYMYFSPEILKSPGQKNCQVEFVSGYFLSLIFMIKMSECLRTYGPQIIRVPQLQIED